ncbi:dihydrofolate reductase [Macrococcus hajekii]|uniref:Dihydrofolate reductase n=1 Tax=Macrococcus hajekii TaxID=198482 RepID=A0A4R6BM45_9STAP|nr:dihydrofolate reductase family protein [Macrococcus hajekii]TDM02801.1 dihydrofolate reductase [Macrococcus hajekii]GGB04008.1 dihydrofolate reductase [Macrococcus hajekii]
MTEVIAYLAMSIDGFIATTDNQVDWLEAAEGSGDNGYSEFYSSIGKVVMGRQTFDWILHHTDVYPYSDKQSYILTHENRMDTANIHFINKDIKLLINELKSSEGNVWIVGGGQIVTMLTQLGLIDRYILTIAPIILGEGVPLFIDGTYRKPLELIDSKVYKQFVQLTYVKTVNKEE